MKLRKLRVGRSVVAERLLFLCVLLLGWGCDDESIEMRLLVYDKEIDAYALEDVSVSTLQDVRTLSGDATVIKSGLSLTLNYEKGNLDWKEESHAVAFSAVKDGNVLVPSTFDSLSMASIYYHMELSYLFYRDEIGLDDGVIKRLPTYYNPEIVIVESNGEKYTMTDNAFYLKISDSDRGFFIVPFQMFQWIPIALNTGIVTHEYSHYIFDRVLLDNLPALDTAGENFLRAFNEGFADYMAAARTEDPDFMAPSIPSGLFVTPECNASKNVELSRDLAHPIQEDYDKVMDFWARHTSNIDDFCPYEIGLQLAGTFYQMARAIDIDRGVSTAQVPTRQTMVRVGRYIINGMEGLGAEILANDTFELWYMYNNLVKSISDAVDRYAICNTISERYALYFSEVSGC